VNSQRKALNSNVSGKSCGPEPVVWREAFIGQLVKTFNAQRATHDAQLFELDVGR